MNKTHMRFNVGPIFRIPDLEKPYAVERTFELHGNMRAVSLVTEVENVHEEPDNYFRIETKGERRNNLPFIGVLHTHNPGHLDEPSARDYATAGLLKRHLHMLYVVETQTLMLYDVLGIQKQWRHGELKYVRKW